ncbi:MAG: ATP-dependent DNA helicase RecG [Clostridia bacterium]|nr:ATP-dependent DNA helicase RecG [Clostridia bacterium]
MWDNPLTCIRGIGEKRAQALQKMGVSTVRDLLYLLPRDYWYFSVAQPVAMLKHGDLVAVRVRIETVPKLARVRSTLNILSCYAQDETGRISLTWYNQPYRAKSVEAGTSVIACGRVDRSRGIKMINPMLYPELPGIQPIYPLVAGINQKQIRDSIHAALSLADGSMRETLPAPLRLRYGLAELNFALRNLHFPADHESLANARKRLVFEDILQYLMLVQSFRAERLSRPGRQFCMAGIVDEFCAKLPFPLTGAQKRVMSEIAKDMAAPVPMNRLLQGDVGSGKTVLALFCLYAAMKNGCQGVLMAPTDILAQQHYASMQKLFGEECCLIKGGMKKKEREALLADIASGKIKAIVGTHALLQSDIEFHRLGIVVTDEQHRFGVRQRAVLSNKGEAPDVLIMSATPIPRTLALIMYGDLDVSVIDELPPGRKPIMTRCVPQHRRDDMYGFIEKQAAEGRQAYVVCPLVDKSETMEVKSAQEVHKELAEKLPNLSVGLLHGQMAAAKKDAVIREFHSGAIDVLVSTTVVEVGVDVPNATVMVIESADRFGLAQLHQLRGRVGRGEHASYCFLLSDSDAETVMNRLSVMTKSQDGFEIAQRDLELRGPGEFLGSRQHGMSEFAAARLASNMEVLKLAQEAVQALGKDPELMPFKQPLMDAAAERFKGKMSEIAHN